MKFFSNSILLFSALSIASFKSVNAIWPEKPKYNVTDVVQYDNLSPTNTSIQWDFMDSKVVEMNSPDCNSHLYPSGRHCMSYINVLFNTTELLQNWGDYWGEVEFLVHCPHLQSNNNAFSFDGTQLNPSKNYTSLTLFVGKCKRWLPRRSNRVYAIELKFVSRTTQTSISLATRTLSPAPNDNCACLSNFKTIFIKNLPQ